VIVVSQPRRLNIRISRNDLDAGDTDHAGRPDACAIHKQPPLLTKPNNVLPAAHSQILGKGGQDMLHGCGAQPGQQHNAEGNKVGIVYANTVVAGMRVTIRKSDKLARVFAGPGHDHMGKEEESKEVERKAYETRVR